MFVEPSYGMRHPGTARTKTNKRGELFVAVGKSVGNAWYSSLGNWLCVRVYSSAMLNGATATETGEPNEPSSACRRSRKSEIPDNRSLFVLCQLAFATARASFRLHSSVGKA